MISPLPAPVCGGVPQQDEPRVSDYFKHDPGFKTSCAGIRPVQADFVAPDEGVVVRGLFHRCTGLASAR